jgi:hypothetical protein
MQENFHISPYLWPTGPIFLYVIMLFLLGPVDLHLLLDLGYLLGREYSGRVRIMGRSFHDRCRCHPRPDPPLRQPCCRGWDSAGDPTGRDLRPSRPTSSPFPPLSPPSTVLQERNRNIPSPDLIPSHRSRNNPSRNYFENLINHASQ